MSIFTIKVLPIWAALFTLVALSTEAWTSSPSLFLASRTNGRSFLSRRHVSPLDEAESTGDSEIPQLPAFGGSSSGRATTGDETANPEQQVGPYVGSKYMQLQYTCKICDTRNQHRVSRLAYLKGMVVAKCKGCDNNHLIADNLGSGFNWDGAANIEDYFASIGQEDAVSRVSREVFDLETIWGVDTKGGALHGKNGERMME